MTDLKDLLAKKAKGDNIAKMAVALRDEVDRDLDAMAKAHASEHGVGYFEAYSVVTADGVGRSMLEDREDADRLVMGQAYVSAE